MRNPMQMSPQKECFSMDAPRLGAVQDTLVAAMRNPLHLVYNYWCTIT